MEQELHFNLFYTDKTFSEHTRLFLDQITAVNAKQTKPALTSDIRNDVDTLKLLYR